MGKKNYREAIRFWQDNGEAKKDLDRRGDSDGLVYGLYDDLPVWMNRYYSYFQNLVVTRFLKQRPPSETSNVVEIGCGSGRWCHRLSGLPQRTVAGLDVSRHILAANRNVYNNDVTYVNASASEIPFAAGSVELAISITVLHHLPPHFQELALAEIRRILGPGGSLFMIESTEVDSASDHLFARPHEAWSELLRSNGLEILDETAVEYIDFRRIVRPLRRAVRSLVGNRRKLSPAEGATRHPSETRPPPGLVFRLFHLLFLPLVLLAWPLEMLRYRIGNPKRANYTCLLATKR